MGMLDVFKPKRKPRHGKRSFYGANTGRLFADFISSSRSADSEIRPALRILRDLAGVDRQEGAQLLAESQGSVKLALLMAAAEQPAAAAASLLEDCGGSLRQALAQAGVQLKAPQ